jgi:hypothetical protein
MRGEPTGPASEGRQSERGRAVSSRRVVIVPQGEKPEETGEPDRRDPGLKTEGRAAPGKRTDGRKQYGYADILG